ncbi:metalloregulator ArsR/SmtB family transcription factor [uncultured Pseudoteredinibacter sp.]|uniref:ArsR/SmtB family transcription factor n=1 Tax=uncultured Pseudoteredinibacter sp. TaxID=1641701 RepID=UPI00260EA474|nr:metalloregulator ArsR/SmtB family transcription factor [uncultured Pseudoteredinibacter sp.]
MTLDPVQFYKAMADDTRLRALHLIVQQEELCVCELTEALDLSQPKVSRHLAQLRKQGVLSDRRAGQWVFYSINPNLPDWAKQLLQLSSDENRNWTKSNLKRLEAMDDRPARCC